MTGLYQRAPFIAKTNEMLACARQHNTQVGYALVDLDRFKDINDTYGHQAGDAALAYTAKMLKNNVRTIPSLPVPERRYQSNDGASDLVGKITEETVELGRVGGDELGIALYGVSAEQAWAVAERLHKALREKPFVYNGTTVPLSVSIGIAATTETMTTWDDLYHGADEALYRAKRSGRNRTELFTQGVLPAAGLAPAVIKRTDCASGPGSQPQLATLAETAYVTAA